MALKDRIAWFKTNFGAKIIAATATTPFDLDMIAAMAVQETGHIWGRLIGKGLTTEQILELCVGDVINAPKRSAFPRDKAALLAWPRGDEMYAIARKALADMAAHITEYQPYVANTGRFCRGYGLFQYDLQFFKTDPDYFLERRYIHFDETLGKCLSELKTKLAKVAGEQGWAANRTLSDMDKAAVAIAYNTGGYNAAKGLKQGHKNEDGKYYGELFFDYMKLSQTVPMPGPAPTPAPTPGPIPVPTPSPAPAPGEAMIVDVVSTPLNLRSKPETGNNVLARLPDGLPVQAFEAQNGFRRVTGMLIGQAVQGWASAQYLKPAGEAMVVDVASTPLNVRSAPVQAAGNVIAKLLKGHQLRAFETQNGFRRVTTVLDGNAVDGWASTQFLKPA